MKYNKIVEAAIKCEMLQLANYKLYALLGKNRNFRDEDRQAIKDEIEENKKEIEALEKQIRKLAI